MLALSGELSGSTPPKTMPIFLRANAKHVHWELLVLSALLLHFFVPPSTLPQCNSQMHLTIPYILHKYSWLRVQNNSFEAPCKAIYTPLGHFGENGPGCVHQQAKMTYELSKNAQSCFIIIPRFVLKWRAWCLLPWLRLFWLNSLQISRRRITVSTWPHQAFSKVNDSLCSLSAEKSVLCSCFFKV